MARAEPIFRGCIIRHFPRSIYIRALVPCRLRVIYKRPLLSDVKPVRSIKRRHLRKALPFSNLRAPLPSVKSRFTPDPGDWLHPLIRSTFPGRWSGYPPHIISPTHLDIPSSELLDVSISLTHCALYIMCADVKVILARPRVSSRE